MQLLLKEVMYRLQFTEFFTQSDLTRYREQLDLLLKLKLSVADEKQMRVKNC